jgi:hypothetical protein
LAVGRDPNPGTVKIARLPSSGADSAYSIDWGRCRPDRIVARDTEAAFPIGTRLAAYEPYADYASSEWRALDLLPQAAQLLSGPAPSRDWRLEPSKDPEWRSVFVDEVLASRAERLWLVQGPPGTGKTTLMAQAAQRILRQEPKARVLFLAQTHRALDEIRAKLDEVGVPHHSHRVEGQVQVRTLAAAAVAPAVPDGGYDYVFVDEASQVTIALGLVAVGKCEPGQGVLRLFGDDRQLDPVFPVVQYPQQLREAWRSMNTPDHAGFHQCTRELLQGGRLPLRDPAALASVDGLAELTEAALALPWSRSWLGCAAAELPGLGSLLAVRKTMLTRGHRLAPVLTTVVSTLWYQSQLQSCVDSADAFAISGAALGVAHGPARQTLGQLIRPLLQHEIVVLIHGHEADRSQVNEFEAAVAVHAKRVLDARPGQDRKRVGIVTPFRRQEKAIDLLWRQFEQPALGPDELATPERYQGRDLDAAVVSLSVGDANTYNRPGRVYTPNKLTVAVSRARYRLLVMVPRTLLGACAVANPNSQAYLDSVRSFVAEVEAVQGKRGRASVMRLA